MTTHEEVIKPAYGSTSGTKDLFVDDMFMLFSLCSTTLKAYFFSANESIAVAESSKTLVPIKTLIDTSPLALTYLLYMLVTMESVRGVNVPMYTTLRRTTVVFTMIVEYILVRQRYTRPILGSVALIVFGAFIAGARDLSFDTYGYLVVFLANITTAIYLATIARIGKTSGLNSFGLMWCNGILCGPVLLLWTLFRGDLEMTMNFPYLLSPGFLTICGNLKDLFTISLGWVIFGGLPFDLLNVIGQLLGFIGSGMYAYYKLIGK
ncbi:UNVERIFIED_CONTAM: UDP-N-acetylglucosamine transporter UGNT1 [Sesamum calycinum]|uniref:UDP-N-acetylglucosamine transporter UGNT1 n=1 Tax=Sesamum calycinum TaxID=2727403 RepID=A0AAW2QW21_9LAMI